MTDVPFTQLNPGVGGDKILNDSLVTINGVAATPSDVEMQRSKIGFGAAGEFYDVTPAQRLPVDVSFPGTQPISASALPLPAGAATAAAQASGNSALANIDGDLGAPSDAAYSGSGSASVIAALKGVYSLLAAPLPAGTNAIGTVSVSGTVAISATSLPLPAGAATAANQASGNATLTAISGQLPATLGQTAMAGSMSVTLASDQSPLAITAASLPLPTGAATSSFQSAGNNLLALIDSDIGATTDAAAAADGTGNYSLVAAAKRALLNWANLLARIPAALGQATMAGSWPVAIASDQSALTVRPDNVQDSLTTSGSVSAATTIVSVSNAGFQGGSFQVTSAGTSCTITYEQSNDGTRWDPLAVGTPGGTPSPSSTQTTAGIYNFTCSAAFVRARVSTYTSGTVAVTLVQKRFVVPTFMSLGTSGNNLGNVTIGAASNTIGNLTRLSGFTDSSTALAANATFTGTGRVTTSSNYPLFVANVFADQAGTLFIDLSVDTGTTYRTIKTQAVTAGTAAELVAQVTGAGGTATLYRVRYTNGATAQGAFQLSSAFRA